MASNREERGWYAHTFVGGEVERVESKEQTRAVKLNEGVGPAVFHGRFGSDVDGGGTIKGREEP